MHGVYVNGRKIARAEIFRSDEIRFGSQVTRSEGDYLPGPQGFSFSEYSLLTSTLPAVHDGIEVRVSNIVRDGAVFTATTIPDSHKSTITPSYRVPETDTDSDEAPPLMPTQKATAPSSAQPAQASSRNYAAENEAYSFAPDVSSPFRDDDDFSDNDSDSNADDTHDYPENPDDLDDDEMSYSEGGESAGLSEDWDDYPEEEEEDIDSESDEPFDTQVDTQAKPELEMIPQDVTQAAAACPQPEETTVRSGSIFVEHNTSRPAVLSVPWLLEPTKDSSTTLDITPSAPPNTWPFCPASTETSKNEENVVGNNFSNQVEEEDFKESTRAAEQTVEQTDTLEATGAEDQDEVTPPVPTAAEIFHRVDSPTGNKRKRDVEDDGHEEAPVSSTCSSTGRKLLKLKFGSRTKAGFKQLLSRTKPVPERPTKRAKRTKGDMALGAVAGALGGMAAVFGFLMTPQCEQLLQDWPIA